MKKKIVKITESHLKEIIENNIKEVLNSNIRTKSSDNIFDLDIIPIEILDKG